MTWGGVGGKIVGMRCYEMTLAELERRVREVVGDLPACVTVMRYGRGVYEVWLERRAVGSAGAGGGGEGSGAQPGAGGAGGLTFGAHGVITGADIERLKAERRAGGSAEGSVGGEVGAGVGGGPPAGVPPGWCGWDARRRARWLRANWPGLPGDGEEAERLVGEWLAEKTDNVKGR